MPATRRAPRIAHNVYYVKLRKRLAQIGTWLAVGALYRWHSLFIGVIRPIDVPGALTGIATFGA